MRMARLPGRKGIRQAVRWFASRRRPHVVLLGYHRVGERHVDPFDLTVTAQELDEQLGVLARRARPVPLRQAVEEIARGVIPPRTVVVTFDDGYEDTIATALPLLRRHEVPATVFVTTGNPGEPFWWDTLASLVLGAPRLPDRIVVEAGGRSHLLSTRPREQFLRRTAAILRAVDARTRRAIIDGVVEPHAPNDLPPAPRALRSEEIQRLGREPLVEVGGHTVTHPLLASLPAERQRAEIDENRLTLELLTGGPVRSFSYPHGSFTPATRNLLQDAGYTAACCSVPDVATAGSDPYALPRLWVDGERGRRFDRWIDHWLG